VRRAPLLLALVLLAPACKHNTTPPAATPTDDLAAARARLAVLAQATASGIYDATYVFVQQGTNARGTIRIRQRPPFYRIDIARKDTASFFSLHRGIVSCSRKGKKKSCFLVARPGEEVPALFDPGVQRLFRDAVEDLAAHPDEYAVSRLPGPPSASSSPAALGVAPGECFLVNRPKPTATTAPRTRVGFENGTYCFTQDGMATLIDVNSGSLTLVKVGPAPTMAAFKPITTVVKLPTLKK
jgi:hypothetical protein